MRAPPLADCTCLGVVEDRAGSSSADCARLGVEDRAGSSSRGWRCAVSSTGISCPVADVRILRLANLAVGVLFRLPSLHCESKCKAAHVHILAVTTLFTLVGG